MIRQFTIVPALLGIFAMIISACSDEIGNLAGSEESSSRNSSPESSVSGSSSNSQTASMTGLSIGSNASQNADSVFASNYQSNLGGNGSLSGRIKSVPYFYTYEGWGSEGRFTGIFILDDGSLVERNNWANDYFTPVELKNIKYIPDPKTSSEYDYSQCALTEAGDVGDVYCWGTNEYGEVGNGNFDNTLKEEKKTCLTEDCLWSRTDYVYNPFKVLSGVQSLIAPDYNTYCALDVLGDIYCWGENTGFTDSSINMVNTPTLVDPNEVDITQYRFMDLETGVFVGSQNPTEVSGYSSYNETSSCKIHESGKVTCQGDNSGEGMLFGKDNKVVAYSANPIEINGVEQAELFTTDDTFYKHVCVLRTDDKIQCWGDDLNEGVVTYTP